MTGGKRSRASAIGVTETGVQAFDYRGVAHISTTGKVVVLHPDEIHDGHAGTEAGCEYRLALDSLMVQLAEGLVDADPCCKPVSIPWYLDVAALERARQFLDAEKTRVVRSSELEAETGLTRDELARQFRVMYGTSPYRYLPMRRLDVARAQTAQHPPLVAVAFTVGFVDQAHFTRMVKSAFGITPARYGVLTTRRSSQVSSIERGLWDNTRLIGISI